MTLQIQHIDHVALTVRDIELSTQWYGDVLGLEHRFRGLWGGIPAMLFAGESGLALFPANSNTPGPTPDDDTIAMRHLAFRVDCHHFAGAQLHLTTLGIPFTFQDHEIAHSIYFVDPDGHQLEITTYELPN